MTDNKTNIQDDEFRVLGHRQEKPVEPELTPTPRKWAGLVSLLLILVIGLLIYFNWPKGEDPEIDPGVFDPTPVKLDPEAERLPLGSIPDSLGTVVVERIDTTVNDVQLSLYIPHNATPRLTLGAPDAETRKAILAFQAADIRADNRQILGAFVLKGKPLAWGLSKKCYCAIIDGQMTIGVA